MNIPPDSNPSASDDEPDGAGQNFHPECDDIGGADSQWCAPSSPLEHALCDLQGRLSSLVFLHDVTTHALRRFRAAPWHPEELAACCALLRVRLGQFPASNRVECWLHATNSTPARDRLLQLHGFLGRCYALAGEAAEAVASQSKDGTAE